MNTRIKICGIQSADIALEASRAGADALGFMFYPSSKRHLQLDQAVEILKFVPPFVTTVAVMVNPEAEYVRNIIALGIDQLQFHGEEGDDFCAGFGKPYVKAIRVNADTDMAAIEGDYPGCSGLLLDTYVKDMYGGSGESFDWKLANYGAGKPIILAGGLHAGNVQDAIKTANPYAVDVSSGVESNGNKDITKIQEFCDNVRQLIL